MASKTIISLCGGIALSGATVLILTMSSAASAQRGGPVDCPEGWHPVMRQDGVWQCGADEYIPPERPPHPLETRDPSTFNQHIWGAIYESEDSKLHWSSKKTDKRSAMAEAEANCIEHNGGKCRLAAAPRNNWVMVSGYKKRNYFGTGLFPREAQQKAEKKCRKAGGSAAECQPWFVLFSNEGRTR